MQGDTRKLRLIFIAGSAIPLVVYVLWQLATLGSIATDTFLGVLAQRSGINGLLGAIQAVAQSGKVEMAVRLFAGFFLLKKISNRKIGFRFSCYHAARAKGKEVIDRDDERAPGRNHANSDGKAFYYHAGAGKNVSSDDANDSERRCSAHGRLSSGNPAR